MTTNPFLNAAAAAVYVAAVASLMYYGPEFFGPEESALVPIAILSLFVLSAAVMGYLFVFQPVRLYLDNHKGEAVRLFGATVLSFAVITALLFVALLFSAS